MLWLPCLRPGDSWTKILLLEFGEDFNRDFKRDWHCLVTSRMIFMSLTIPAACLLHMSATSDHRTGDGHISTCRTVHLPNSSGRHVSKSFSPQATQVCRVSEAVVKNPCDSCLGFNGTSATQSIEPTRCLEPSAYLLDPPSSKVSSLFEGTCSS